MKTFKRIGLKCLICILLALCVVGAVALAGCGETPNNGDDGNVNPVDCGLAISDSNVDLNINETYILTAKTNDDSLYSLSWSTSNSSVASIVGNGGSCTITAVSSGTATITVGCKTKGTTANLEEKTCSVTVTDNQIVLNFESVMLLPDVGLSKHDGWVSIDAHVLSNGKDLDVTVGDMSWSSSDESVATVESGTVTAHKTGSAVVTAKYEDLSADCRVIVANTAGIEVDETVSCESSSAAASWASDDENVATVDEVGLVTGVSAGTATITKTLSDGTSEDFIVTVKHDELIQSEEANYTVPSGKKADAVVDPGTWYYLLESAVPDISEDPVYSDQMLAVDITRIGDSGSNFFYLRYQPDDTGHIDYDVSLYIWAADDGIIAINGVDTTVNKGVNRFTLNYTSKEPSSEDPFQFKFRTATAYVIAPMFVKTGENLPETSITVEPSSVELVVDQTYQLVATYEEGSEFTWSSNNESVATVDQNGLVTAHSVGEADITVSCDGKSATCHITVTGDNLSLSQTFGMLYMGSDGATEATLTLTAATADESEMTWSSSNEQVATVTDGTVIAVGAGYVYITVTDGTETKTCTVFVVNTESSYSLTSGNKTTVVANPGIWYYNGQKGNSTAANYNDGAIYASWSNVEKDFSGDNTYILRYQPYVNGDCIVSFDLTVNVSDDFADGGKIKVTLNSGDDVLSEVEYTAEQLAETVSLSCTVTCTVGSSGYFQLKVSGSDLCIGLASVEINVTNIVLTPVETV